MTLIKRAKIVHACISMCMCVHVVVWLLNSIPMDYSPPGSSVHGIFQEYWSRLTFCPPGDLPDPVTEPTICCIVGGFFTTELPGKPHVCMCDVHVCVRMHGVSHVWLFVSPWTVACQAPLFMEFSGQEYWREISYPLPDPGIKPTSHASPALTGRFFTTAPPRNPIHIHTHTYTIYTNLYIYSYIHVWVGDGQGGLACCNSWSRKESDTTERLNWTDA